MGSPAGVPQPKTPTPQGSPAGVPQQERQKVGEKVGEEVGSPGSVTDRRMAGAEDGMVVEEAKRRRGKRGSIYACNSIGLPLVPQVLLPPLP